MGYAVSTERLGWPPKRWWRDWWPIEAQKQLRYDDEPERPTATCHLQQGPEVTALCGYPWEALITVPSQPDWNQIHPDLRCEECSQESVSDTRTVAP